MDGTQMYLYIPEIKFKFYILYKYLMQSCKNLNATFL